MSTGWVGLAATVLGLLSGAPAADTDVVHINQQRFTIPIRVVPERQHEVRELLLFMSRDRGQTWEVYARATPDKKGFDFYAAGDGLFYFSIAVIDRSGRQDPVDVYRAPVGQKILIDTKKPTLQLTADRSGDEVLVDYVIQEDRPERESLKLEYKAGDSPGGQWTPLPIEFAPRGKMRFRPGAPGPLTVRLSLRDLAGNEATEEKSIGGSAMRTDNQLVRTTGDPQHVGNTTGSMPPPPSPPSPPPLSMEQPPAGRSGSPLAVTQPQAPPPQPSEDPASHAFAASSGNGPTRGALPALQIVNKRQVKLGFDVTRFGPSGLGSVDVYVTTDEGATWEKSQADPNVTLPVTAETRGAQPVRGSVTVNLPKDGLIYGFFLVVKSRAGLGKEPPRPGDPPQVRIELDTMQPEAELYAPQSDTVRPDCLVLTWKASDRNLAPNPISIEWSARPDGPWTFIGDAQLANTGRYLWQIAENTPAKVYLKLSVRDTAGNTAVALTPQPVLIDLTRPDVTGVRVER
jgi:hypothetical protein